MKLIRLEAQNVKRLKAVSITFDGKSAVIGGKNANGKTSTLDAIEMALGGAKSICQEPIRHGEESARTVLDLEDIIVKRTFTAGGGSELVVSDKSGKKYSSPQKMLDDLTGRTMRDPLAFTRMEPKKQLAMLKELVGLDTAELDEKRQALYEERAEAGRDVAGRKGQLDSMPEFPEVGFDEKAPEQHSPKLASTAELSEQLEAAREHNRRRAEMAETCDGFRSEIRARDEAIAKAQAQISTWTKVWQKAVKDKESLESDLVQAEKAAAAVMAIDTNPLHAMLAGVEEKNKAAVGEAARLNSEAYAAAKAHNDKVRANRVRRDLATQFRDAKQKYDDLTEKIEAIDKEKSLLLSKAKFPVPGLGFGLQGVTLNDIPFEQASSAEQLRVSTAMALALCPDRPDAIKLLLVRDGSLLDDDSLAAMFAQVDAAGGQLLMERVGEGDEVSVVIEDGTVKSTQTKGK